MNLQLLILDTLRAMPHWLLTWVGGKPQEIDRNRLDMNMQVLPSCQRVDRMHRMTHQRG